MDAIERVFHEPNRMSILSVLCASRGGMPFTELRDRCGLTDDNLNRHVKTGGEGNRALHQGFRE